MRGLADRLKRLEDEIRRRRGLTAGPPWRRVIYMKDGETAEEAYVRAGVDDWEAPSVGLVRFEVTPEVAWEPSPAAPVAPPRHEERKAVESPVPAPKKPTKVFFAGDAPDHAEHPRLSVFELIEREQREQDEYDDL